MVSRSIQEAADEQSKIKQRIDDSASEIQQKRAAHLHMVGELWQIIEDQKREIVDHLHQTEVPDEIKPVPDGCKPSVVVLRCCDRPKLSCNPDLPKTMYRSVDRVCDSAAVWTFRTINPK
jgi:hypothetical protein